MGSNAIARLENQVVLSGGPDGLEPTAAGFYVKPVESKAGTANLAYDSGSGEIYVASSSQRYKTNIETVTANEAANVWNLRPVSYHAIKDADKEDAPVYYGFIAEEVAEVDPRLCFWGQDPEGMPQVEGVNYDQVFTLLVAETKQLKAAREKDAIRLAELEAKVEALLLKLA